MFCQKQMRWDGMQCIALMPDVASEVSLSVTVIEWATLM